MTRQWMTPLPLALAIASGLLPAVPASAALVLTGTSAYTNLASSGPTCPPPDGCLIEHEDALLATVSQGSTSSSADVAAGVIRAYTEGVGDASGTPVGVGTGAEIVVTLRNSGSNPVHLPAGALVFNVDATFLRTVGLVSGTTVAASLAYGSDPTNTASAQVQFQVFDVITPNSGTVTFQQSLAGGATLQVRSATTGLLDFSFASGALTVQPGDDLSASFLFQPSVLAGGAGARAVIDATHTAAFALALPAGVEFDAGGVPVRWVSVVPEPPAAWLAACGLLWLLGRRLR